MIKKIALTLTGLLISSQAALALPIIQPIPNINFVPMLTLTTEVPASTFDTTPEFKFTSTEAGTITYLGSCSSTKTDAIAGENIITFSTLTIGTHSDCGLYVTDSMGGKSTDLMLPSFEVKLILLVDVIAPALEVVTTIPTPSIDDTPSFTFKTSEAGTIMYEGACASSTTLAAVGNNTVTFNKLAPGTYSDCKIKVKDSFGNISTPLAVASFTIESTPVLPPAVATCDTFTDIMEGDADCEAVKYVKSIGAMTGNPDGTFKPDDLLQRDQIAKIALETFKLYNASIDYCGSSNPFPDVTGSAWSRQYVCRAKALSVVTGYQSGADKGFFRPSRSVNRVEFLAFLLRNLGESMPGNDSVSYTDVEAGQWYSGLAKYSKTNSLFAGTKLYPTNYVTRGEVAAVILRLHKLGKI